MRLVGACASGWLADRVGRRAPLMIQGSWSLGFLLSSAVYGAFYQYLGWRGMLWIGIVPAITVAFVRSFVKEPKVWVENRRLQREQNRECLVA